MNKEPKKKIRCPRCRRAHDPKNLINDGSTFICIRCGEEFVPALEF